MRRDWLQRVGGFDVALPYCEDVDLFCRMIFAGPWLANASVVGELRRVGTIKDSLSSRIRAERVTAEAIKIKTYKRLLEALSANSDRRRLVSRMISKNWFNAAQALDSSGQRLQAMAYLIRSARQHPTLKGWMRACLPLLFANQGYNIYNRLKAKRYYRNV